MDRSNMNNEHFNFLRSAKHIPQGRVGRNGLNFGKKVQNIEELPAILNQQFDRNSLFDCCRNPNNSNLAVTTAILAWGGMRFDHARTLFQHWNHLDPIVKDLRTGTIQSRLEAFYRIQQQRSLGNLPGLGIGFFTKLICFLNPNLNGFILDQWTGKSINLLYDEKFIIISNTGWVTDNNTPEIYNEFCNRVEHLAEILTIESIMAEELLFSTGGRKRGQWRSYLIKNYV